MPSPTLRAKRSVTRSLRGRNTCKKYQGGFASSVLRGAAEWGHDRVIAETSQNPTLRVSENPLVAVSGQSAIPTGVSAHRWPPPKGQKAAEMRPVGNHMFFAIFCQKARPVGLSVPMIPRPHYQVASSYAGLLTTEGTSMATKPA